MCRFYVKAIGFMHYDFFLQWGCFGGWFWSFVVQDISLEAQWYKAASLILIYEVFMCQ
ncbi:hypothetical protein MCU_01317 [Bartonella elizabethae Re6043vi]|uniref:Uncharacterized protein n=1 Tax=Bartonella elizabethae Re6043vi TaxID=1094554 RepID=A0ABN0GJA1_BAREL|nr:hypothetical protein [Bartonella elizabethae]EJF82816.1 hypothetical protein MCU_01317 [Bartonella elizabethae Re6043vi]